MTQVASRHDERLLDQAALLVRSGTSAAQLKQHLYSIVAAHEDWRGASCLNLVAAEAPASPEVRRLLTSDLGCRASGGHIGAETRFFAGLDEADRLEALCIAVLTQLFSCAHADPRLLGGMHATTVVYAALKPPGTGRHASVMSLPDWAGGDSSNREDGPPKILGYRILDIPTLPDSLEVDLTRFEEAGKRLRPDIVSLGAGINLFPFQVAEMKRIVDQWGGRLFFDGAHQAGLIAGGCYPNPLQQGADLFAGSTGKTFSGPQGGLLCWNDAELTERICDTIFPHLTGTHQLQRVAALALAGLELQVFGADYMGQMVRNAQALAAGLAANGLEVMGAERGFTQTHQVVALLPGRDADGHGAAHRLAKLGLIANKAMLPRDRVSGGSSGLRFGTAEVTRLGMRETEMQAIAELIADGLLDRRPPRLVSRRVRALRDGFRGLRFCWSDTAPDAELAPAAQSPAGQSPAARPLAPTAAPVETGSL